MFWQIRNTLHTKKRTFESAAVYMKSKNEGVTGFKIRAGREVGPLGL